MPEEIIRSSVTFKDCSERFAITNCDFSKQYCKIYIARLKKMKEILACSITKKWKDDYPVCDLHKLPEVDYPKCIIIGTLFKDQKFKPSILKQLAEVNNLIPQPIVSHFTDESDSLYIEDELQRYQLLGSLKHENLVTGITVALLGTDIGKGKFMIENHCFAGYGPQIERPLYDEDVFVVFISGLDLLHIEQNALAFHSFVDWLTGRTGIQHDIDRTKIVRLMMVGNSVQISTEKIKTLINLTSRCSETVECIEAVKSLDSFLLELCQSIDVDLMPGEHDPSNHILPQKSLHHCLFPKSSLYNKLHLASNPYDCEVGGVRLLGTSGQPLKNILDFSDITDPLEVLECCLKWSHLAPTAPDTLGCYPYYDHDPFIIKECPHVLFAGNQEKFCTKLVTGEEGQIVRLICIPQFVSSCTAVVLNLKDLDCFSIKLDVF